MRGVLNQLKRKIRFSAKFRFLKIVLSYVLPSILALEVKITASIEMRSILTLTVISIIILLIKTEKGSFHEYGFVIPDNISKYTLASLLLAFFYVTVIIFLPGGVRKFAAYPPYNTQVVLENAISILFETISLEVIFRGYMQTSLMKILDSPYVILIVSTIFTLFMLPTSANEYNSTYLSLLLSIISTFTKNVFLCVYLRKTGTLLSTILYSASITFLSVVTPVKPIDSEYLSAAVSAVLHTLFALILTFRPNCTVNFYKQSSNQEK